jgi:hypothetical protein
VNGVDGVDGVNGGAGRSVTFVVRIWRSPSGLHHGQISHVPTRRTAYFKSFRRMLAFIAARLRAPEPSPPERLPAEPGEGAQE